MLKDLMAEASGKMEKAIDALVEDLRTIRTGRATPALLDRIVVEYYGTMTPLNQVSTISVPEPRMLTIRPWESSMIGPIEKAILKSELGLTPTNDGKLIRLVIPRLSEERRNDLSKVVRRRVEDAKVAVRNLRREAIDDLRDFEAEKMISEDDLYKGRDQVQELTDKFVAQSDEIGQRKEEEIREV